MVNKLIQGFQKFRDHAYQDGEDALMPSLVRDGQQPDYFIISCIDSRANPGTILTPDPGTFFAFKSMGAVVRPYKQGTALAASLQFALEHMKVPNLILFGHTQCGAIKALAEDIDDPEIASFIDVAKTGLEIAEKNMTDQNDHEDLLREAEKQVVVQGLENLKTYPSVAKALKEGRLNLSGWIFDMKQGVLLEHSKETGLFENITSPSNITMSNSSSQKGTCCA